VRKTQTDPEAARECQAVLCGWLRDDIDPQATSTILQEVKNIGGVYKDSLAPYMDIVRNLSTYGDSKVSDIAKDIIRYFDGTSLYLAEAFLNNQVSGELKADVSILGVGLILEVVPSHRKISSAVCSESSTRSSRPRPAA
jgi:hypothetical protein